MTAPDWLFWAIAAPLVLVGLALLHFGLFHDRARCRRRCPKCWYDMGGTGGFRCPECGREAGLERALHRTRRRPLWVAAGLLLVLGPMVGVRVWSDGWEGLVPDTALILSVGRLPYPYPRESAGWLGGLSARLDTKVTQDRLWGWQKRWLARRATAAIDARTAPSNGLTFPVMMLRQLTEWQVEDATRASLLAALGGENTTEEDRQAILLDMYSRGWVPPTAEATLIALACAPGRAEETRRWALTAMGRLDWPSSACLEVLRSHVGDEPDFALCGTALKAVLELKGRAGPLLLTIRDLATRLAVNTPENRDELHQYLRFRAEEASLAVTEGLAEPQILERLSRHEDPQLRVYAAIDLRYSMDQEFAAPILERLRHDTNEVVREAVDRDFSTEPE
jgi:hypothetical protein